MADTEIITERNPYGEEAVEEAVSGEPRSTGFQKQVYLDHAIPERAVKIPYNLETEQITATTDRIARTLSRLPGRVLPETEVGVYDLEDQGYASRQPVVFQEESEEPLVEKAEKQPVSTFSRGLRFLDRAAETGHAFPDLIWNNLHSFSDGLKPIDLCELGAVKSLPESYRPGNTGEFLEDVEEMYKSFAFSGRHVTGMALEDVAELLENSSQYVKTAGPDPEAAVPYQQLRISLLEDSLEK